MGPFQGWDKLFGIELTENVEDCYVHWLTDYIQSADLQSMFEKCFKIRYVFINFKTRSLVNPLTIINQEHFPPPPCFVLCKWCQRGSNDERWTYIVPKNWETHFRCINWIWFSMSLFSISILFTTQHMYLCNLYKYIYNQEKCILYPQRSYSQLFIH